MRKKIVFLICVPLLLLPTVVRTQLVKVSDSASPSEILAVTIDQNLNLLAFYYPWYGTLDVSGYWFHWNDATHNPDKFLDGRRQIAAKHYPLLDVYDCNNESLIERHVDIARRANIDGFVVSWWGRNSFEDKALLHIKDVCDRIDFKFTIYYETTSSVSYTVNDLMYLLNNYADTDSWYRIDGRPVIYVYSRAVHQLNPQRYWKIDGNTASWRLFEDVREPPRCGIFVIEPYKDRIGYVESGWITLPPNEAYSLKVGISDMRNDCPPNSDVGFRIKIKNETGYWETLDDLVVNFDDGWIDLSYDISSYAGQSVSLRVESYDGGVVKWCSEWAAVDYLFIMDSKGEILNQGPCLDNEWKTVVETLTESGYDPYFIMDFGGHEHKVEYFAEYFLNFTDGIHTYNPVALSVSDISEVYNMASNAAHSKNKTFVATVVPGYDDTEVRSPGYVVDRQNGFYYNSSWSVAKSSLPDEYIITSFNEWHEGTEIEPSLEYHDFYINLTYSNTVDLIVHDVAIENVSPSKTVMGQGSTTSINVSVINRGDCIENLNVTVYVNSTILERQPVANLAHGTKTNLQTTWNTTDMPLGTYEIKAVAKQVENETIVTNNNFICTIIVSILGDINGDYIVDIYDVVSISIAFGSEPGDENWNSNADLNNDDIVDIYDVVIVASNFGETA